MLVIGNENEAYVELLCGHLLRFVRRLRAMPAATWDWQPNSFTPSPRFLAQHVWLWLVCDRHHILQPDALQHPVHQPVPAAQEELCALLDQETRAWRTLIQSMTPDQLAETRFAFNWRRVNVRWLIWHMCQNVIYKHGQLATLYFQLGLDGAEPYEAPLPNDDYARLAEMTRRPAIQWALAGEVGKDLPSTVREEIDAPDQTGSTALHYAVWRGDGPTVRVLVENGADVNCAYGLGWTPLMDAAWLGHLEIVRVLLHHGADLARRTTSGYSALDLALEEDHWSVVEVLQQWETGGEWSEA